jgi:hypothetical protein
LVARLGEMSVDQKALKKVEQKDLKKVVLWVALKGADLVLLLD